MSNRHNVKSLSLYIIGIRNMINLLRVKRTLNFKSIFKVMGLYKNINKYETIY